LTISDHEIETSLDDDAKAATAKEPQEKVILQFHMDSSVWDMIYKELMEWSDSSWISMHLPGDKMSMLATTSFLSQCTA